MLIWRGLGILVPVICAAVAFGTNGISNSILDEQNIAWKQPGGILWISLTSAVLILALSNLSQIRNRASVGAYDGGGFDEQYSPKADSFLFIPIGWWSLIVLVTGIVTAILRFF